MARHKSCGSIKLKKQMMSREDFLIKMIMAYAENHGCAPVASQIDGWTELHKSYTGQS